MTVYASACIKAYSDFVYFNILARNKNVPNRPVINTGKVYENSYVNLMLTIILLIDSFIGIYSKIL